MGERTDNWENQYDWNWASTEKTEGNKDAEGVSDQTTRNTEARVGTLVLPPMCTWKARGRLNRKVTRWYIFLSHCAVGPWDEESCLFHSVEIHDLILIEVDSKGQWQMPICSGQVFGWLLSCADTGLILRIWTLKVRTRNKKNKQKTWAEASAKYQAGNRFQI